jgi:predicted ABC-type ATPase
LQRAHDSGYNITVAFVYLDSPATCIDRVRQRVRRGGHHVPDEDVRRRFARSCDNFWHIYREIADQWVVYYNAGDKFVEVVFGYADGFAVCDDDLFHRLLEFAGDVNHG